MLELSRSEKDYMEAIFILKRRLGFVRSIDVANHMGHAKPSISRAISVLNEKGCLQKAGHEIVFTELGAQIAEQIALRHCILTHALKELGIDDATAVKDAQNIERIISDESVNCTANLLQCQKRISGDCPTFEQVMPYG